MCHEETNGLLVVQDTGNPCSTEIDRRAPELRTLAAMGQKTAILAHEGRNALHQTTCILGILALKLTDQPELLDLIGRARTAQEGLARLFDDLQTGATSLTLQREVLHVSDVWQEAWSDLEDLRQQKTGELKERVQGDVLCGDRFRLKQAFRNLFENSLTACPMPACIEVHCKQATLPDGRAAIRLTIHDNGPGLSQEQRRRVFELFYTTKSRGMGLGLAITKRIVEAHGGRISVEDGGHCGAGFVIVLPYENQTRPATEVKPAATDEIISALRRPLLQERLRTRSP
jgi:signal transduction histidine kinase